MKRESNKNKEICKAAALKYDANTDNAPYIVALGEGLVAKQMIETAQDNNVQIIKDKQLSDTLGMLNVGDEIPEEMYLVVAEILVFISSMDNEHKTRFGLS